MKCAYYLMDKDAKSKALFDGTVNAKMKRFHTLADKVGEAEAYRQLTGKDPNEIKATTDTAPLEEEIAKLQEQVDKQKAEFEQLTEATKSKE